MKTCFKCNVSKPLENFYAHPEMADGRLGKCKECNKADVRNNYKARRPQYQAYESERAQLPHRVELRTQYRRNNPEICGRLGKKWALKNPDKKQAHCAVSNAVRDGKLVRGTQCERCGSNKNIEGHHDDYSRPLDVRWLCKKCHYKADFLRRALEFLTADPRPPVDA